MQSTHFVNSNKIIGICQQKFIDGLYFGICKSLYKTKLLSTIVSHTYIVYIKVFK